MRGVRNSLLWTAMQNWSTRTIMDAALPKMPVQSMSGRGRERSIGIHTRVRHSNSRRQPAPIEAMKKYLLVLALSAAAVHVRAADIIAQWNFNSVPPDGAVATGTSVPSTGSGTLTLIGGTTNTYATGHTTDPANSGGDNSGINLASFPPQGTSNKTAGIRFAVSTVGYRNIMVSWVQRVSNTGSKYYRVLYSTDGINFFETTNIINLYAANSFLDQSIDLSAAAGAIDNPNFAFEIVSEFEGSAIGSANNNYLTASTSAYTGNGTARFDMMTITGDPTTTQNAPPTISAITNVTMRAETTYPTIPFTIGDAETPAGSLTLNKSSSNPLLFPDGSIVLGGSESNRTVMPVSAARQTGFAANTLTVIDQGGRSNSSVFAVNVVPTNTAPTVSVILNQGTTVDTPTAPIPFTVGDAETAAGNLIVTAYSSNTVALPQAGVVLGGSNASRTISLTPAAGQLGNALVSIRVSDGVFTTNRTFILSVLPSAGTLLYEPFNYPDGPLIVNSLGLWQNHSANTGELSTIGQVLFVTANNSEDVNARLRGEPYTPAGGANLYYSLRLSAYNLPTLLGDYFVRFKDNANTFRGKLFASTTNAALGYYRIGVANGASFPDVAGYAEAPSDIT